MDKHLILLYLMVISILATSAPLCPCSQLTQKDDCNNFNCIWTASNSTCSDDTSNKVCSSYYDQVSCDIAIGCAWTNSGSCASFTKCSDYTVSSGDAYFCNKKDSTCIPDAVSNGSVTCTSGTLSCSAITDETVCNSGLNFGTNQICFWNQKCAAYDVSSCSGITLSNLCTKVGCLYNNSICAAQTCSSVKLIQDCNFFRGDQINSVTACDWNNSTCAELNTSTLNSTTCFGKTGGTHEWSGSSCQACTSSYTMIISALVIMNIF